MGFDVEEVAREVDYEARPQRVFRLTPAAAEDCGAVPMARTVTTIFRIGSERQVIFRQQSLLTAPT